MFINKIIDRGELEASPMSQSMEPAKDTVVSNLLGLDNWLMAAELLLYLWKALLIKGEEKYGIVEELDYTSDRIVPRLEEFMLPEDLRETIYEMITQKKEENILTKLNEMGLVEKTETDRAIRCPICGSYRIRTRMTCPHCGSFKVVPSKLIQHVVCGYTAPEAEFYNKEGKMVCPSCGMPLTKEGEDYIVYGKIFYCENCKRMFKQPQYIFTCENTDTVAHEPGYTFTPLEAKVSSLYKYSLTDKGRELIESGELLIEIIKKHTETMIENIKVLGNRIPEEVEGIPPEIKTLSFDLVLLNEKSGTLVLIDYASKDVVTYVMKITLLRDRSFHYLVIGTHITSPQLLKVDVYADNIHVEDIDEHTIHSLLELIDTILL